MLLGACNQYYQTVISMHTSKSKTTPIIICISGIFEACEQSLSTYLCTYSIQLFHFLANRNLVTFMQTIVLTSGTGSLRAPTVVCGA